MRACAIKVVSRDKLCQELVFESLADWRWSRKIISFNKIIHCVKSVHIWSYSGPHFLRIFLHSDMEYLFVFSPNTGKSGKNADQNNSEYGQFLRSDTRTIAILLPKIPSITKQRKNLLCAFFNSKENEKLFCKN